MAIKPRTQPGRSFPLGSTLYPEGVNFSVFSKSSALVELVFFDRVDDTEPTAVIPLDPMRNRTYHYWHVFVPGIQAGQITAIGHMDPSNRTVDCGLTRVNFCLTRTGKAMAVPDGYSPRQRLRTRGQLRDHSEECGR